MSTAIAKNFQVGSDSTATNNFTIRQPATPDGTVRIANGNSGTTTDLVTVTSAGNVGVGTSSPGAKLDVQGGRSYFASNSDAFAAYLRYNNSTAGVFLGSPSANAFQISNSGGGAYLNIDSSGNLGIGTSSPGAKLEIGALGVFRMQTGSTVFNTTPTAGANDYLVWNTSNSGSGFAWNTNSTERVRIDSSGNLLVGTTSAPANWNTVSPKMRVAAGGIQVGDYCLVCEDAFDTDSLCLVSDSTENICFGNYNRSTLVYTERARITSGGDFLVGTTTTGFTNSRSFTFQGVGDGKVYVNHSTANINGDGYIGFGYNGTQIGSITQNGTTAVAYNTSSDYRLKHDIAPMTGALAKVALLKPCTYKWNADDSAGEGFIAHELAEVCPQAVTGEKDAVDADGNPKYQGIDTSFLVATLTAAIQELKAELDSVKTELALLKGTA